MKKECTKYKLKENKSNWFRIFTLLVFSIFFMTIFVNSISGANWWNPNWEYRQELNISLDSGTSPQDYQTNLILNTSNVGANFSFTNTCNDLRFVNLTNNQLIDYWIESCSSANNNASIWIKVPVNLTTSGYLLYMYYGNNAVSNLSNGENVFDFFDDFEGNLSKWTEHKNSAGITQSGGYVEIGGGSTSAPYGHGVLGSNASYNEFLDGILEGDIFFATDSIAEIGTRGNFSSNSGYKSRIDARAGQGLSHLKPPYTDGSWGFLASCTTSVTSPALGVWTPFKLTVNGTYLTMESEGITKTCTDSEYTTAGEISLQNHYGSYARYDNIRVRKYISSTVNSNLGIEEKVPEITVDSVAQVYDSSFGQDGNAGPISISFDAQSGIVGNFTHSTGTNPNRVYVNSSGLHQVSYSCAWHSKTANNRHIMENWIRVNGVTDIVPSKTNTYLRNAQPDGLGAGNISTAAATTLINFNDGDYFELRGALTSGATGNTETDEDCSVYIKKVSLPVAQIYDSAGGQTLTTGAGIVVNLNANTNIDSIYSLNSDRINVSENGWYKVNYQVCPDQTVGGGGSDRTNPSSWLRLNGAQTIDSSTSTSYLRTDSNGDINCMSATTLVEMNSGDYLELMANLKSQQSTGETVVLIANQNWLNIEKVNIESALYSEIVGGQSIVTTSPTAISFDTNNKTSLYLEHITSASGITFNKSGLYEISYSFGWDDGGANNRHVACGYLRLNGVSDISPSRSCDYSRGTGGSQYNSVSNTLLVNVSKDDYIELMATTTAGTIAVEGEETWITITKINETPKLYWETNSYDLGDQNVSQGDLTTIVKVTALGENNEDVIISCISGDCSTITDNWIDNTNIPGYQEETEIIFTCPDNTPGSYSATFNVNSNQDLIGDDITVTCDINQTYGKVFIDLITPLENSLTNVEQNKTFNLNSSVSCIGVVGSICGNITINSRYNNSISTMANIDGSSQTPIWTMSPQTQSCNLNNGEICYVNWLINLTGNIGERVKINVNTTSNLTQVPDNTSQNTTMNIIYIAPGVIIWDSSLLNLGTTQLNLGELYSYPNIIPSGNHNSTNVTCISGDCSVITDNWIDGINLLDGNTSPVTFICSDNTVGDYSVLYKVNSSVDNSGFNINLSCSITQTYGNLNISLTNPDISSKTIYGQNRTFYVNATVICEGTTGALCGNISANSRYSERNVDFGDGIDGDLIVSSANTIVNSYTYLTGNELEEDDTITIFDPTDFSIGDEILIIQLQNGSGNGIAGTYEFKTISDISGNDLTLDFELENSYYSGIFDQINSQATQIVKVPRYKTVTINSGASITAPAWDGYTGGIVVFRANETINTTGYIDVSEKGFRGGDCNGCGDAAWGDQGEGYPGLGTGTLIANGNGGGGGYGPSGFNGEPGAGGGYGTSGTDGISAFTSIGGESIGNTDLSLILFGGGAGGGGDDDNPAIRAEFVDGSGSVMIFGREIINARVRANGEDGVGNGGAAGTTGGGAGGAVWLNALNLTLTDVTALGGNGFDDSGDVGGDGGNGRIRLDYNSLISGSTNPNSEFNNTNFVDTTLHTKFVFTPISTILGFSPMYTLSSQPLTCNNLISGNSCILSWLVNGTGEGVYRVDVNLTSNLAQVPGNETRDAVIEIDPNPPFQIESIKPNNNSQYIPGQLITAQITANKEMTYAAYYLNGNLSNLTTMTSLPGSESFIANLTNLAIGNYNITFVYNESSILQNTTDTYYFDIILASHKKITKSITSQSTDTYLVRTVIENKVSQTSDIILTEFIDGNFSKGSFNPVQDFINITSGFNYNGEIYVWNLTVAPLSVNQINYSITRVNPTQDYYLSKAFMVGMD